jgi:uncharacterized pyridoxal phosphate-containing UPF0001 family protein
MADSPAARLRQLRSRITAAAVAAGRTEQSVTLVGVSKGHGADAVRAMAQLVSALRRYLHRRCEKTALGH